MLTLHSYLSLEQVVALDSKTYCPFSKLMVTEIRRRASNQSTEAASCAIVRFLEIDSCEESSNGWMLLSTLNLLAAGPPQLIEVNDGHFLFFIIYILLLIYIDFLFNFFSDFSSTSSL